MAISCGRFGEDRIAGRRGFADTKSFALARGNAVAKVFAEGDTQSHTGSEGFAGYEAGADAGQNKHALMEKVESYRIADIPVRLSAKRELVDCDRPRLSALCALADKDVRDPLSTKTRCPECSHCMKGICRRE